MNANAFWLINGTYRFGTGSLHTGDGTNAAFADGHVQWISDNIDGATWETLGGIADSGAAVGRGGVGVARCARNTGTIATTNHRAASTARAARGNARRAWDIDKGARERKNSVPNV